VLYLDSDKDDSRINEYHRVNEHQAASGAIQQHKRCDEAFGRLIQACFK
jgi:hypothetical protein